MTQVDFDKLMLVLGAWRLASSSDVNELVAVACVLRNAVVQRRVRSYSDAIATYVTTHPLRAYPRGDEPQLIDPHEGLLARVDEVYDLTFPDVTSTGQVPRGATEFCNARLRPHAVPNGRRLIGTFGSMQFYE